jgi:hypothetical protein
VKHREGSATEWLNVRLTPGLRQRLDEAVERQRARAEAGARVSLGALVRDFIQRSLDDLERTDGERA